MKKLTIILSMFLLTAPVLHAGNNDDLKKLTQKNKHYMAYPIFQSFGTKMLLSGDHRSVKKTPGRKRIMQMRYVAIDVKTGNFIASRVETYIPRGWQNTSAQEDIIWDVFAIDWDFEKYAVYPTPGTMKISVGSYRNRRGVSYDDVDSLRVDLKSMNMHNEGKEFNQKDKRYYIIPFPVRSNYNKCEFTLYSSLRKKVKGTFVGENIWSKKLACQLAKSRCMKRTSEGGVFGKKRTCKRTK